MIDALLYAVRDTIRAAGIGYGIAECEIVDEGGPPERCGNFFAGVHGGRVTSDHDNCLHELYGFSVTLTMRVITANLDRVGDQQIARNVPLATARKQGFDAKADQLRALLAMNWNMVVVQGRTPPSANDNLIAWGTGTGVYGFCEPARYRGIDKLRIVGGEWFGAEPDGDEVGIVGELRFDGAKRFQGQTAAVGPFI